MLSYEYSNIADCPQRRGNTGVAGHNHTQSSRFGYSGDLRGIDVFSMLQPYKHCHNKRNLIIARSDLSIGDLAEQIFSSRMVRSCWRCANSDYSSHLMKSS